MSILLLPIGHDHFRRNNPQANATSLIIRAFFIRRCDWTMARIAIVITRPQDIWGKKQTVKLSMLRHFPLPTVVASVRQKGPLRRDADLKQGW